MRSRLSRHLQSVLREDVASPTLGLEAIVLERGAEAPLIVTRAEAPRQAISPEFNGHQYAIFLLHVDAGIEHALMVQYLFAAYSLGGPQVPPEHRETVERWQESILGIAKEE